MDVVNAYIYTSGLKMSLLYLSGSLHYTSLVPRPFTHEEKGLVSIICTCIKLFIKFTTKYSGYMYIHVAKSADSQSGVRIWCSLGRCKLTAF